MAFFWRLAKVSLVVAGLVGWLQREPLLHEAASLWIVSDPLTHADAIVVLGGNSQTRPPVAAELYRKGLANKVLVSHPSDCQRNRLRVQVGGASYRDRIFWKSKHKHKRRGLCSQGVDRAKCRMQWIFRLEFSGGPTMIEVQPFNTPDYSREGWWKTDKGSIALKEELLKYLYYRWMY